MRSWRIGSPKSSPPYGRWRCASLHRSARPIDWAWTLLALGIESVDIEALDGTLNVLLKYQADIDKVSKELAVES